MFSGLTYCAQLYMNSSFSISKLGAALSTAAADGAADAEPAAEAGAAVVLPPLGPHAARNAAVPVSPAAARKPRRLTLVCDIRRRTSSRSRSAMSFLLWPEPRALPNLVSEDQIRLLLPGQGDRISRSQAQARLCPRRVLSANDELAGQVGLDSELGLVTKIGALMDASPDR